ncbi:MAG: FAD:protein FMN transferase [Verrucomicrobia bacterium]|nr:MAG: FAD:protein FMN transferase [Verrucomicrobiota bacterium]
MKRRKFIFSLVGTAAAGLTAWKLGLLKQAGTATVPGGNLTGALAAGRWVKVSRSTHALGTQVALTVYHHDQELAEKAIASAFDELEIVEQLMSLYRPDSQLSQLNATGRLADPHPYLVEVLRTANDLSERSRGAFDVTVQPLWTLRHHSAMLGQEPDEAALAQALRNVDWRRITLSDRKIELRGDGTGITLNGIAQGFAADAVRRVLVTHGITSALIDTGEIGTLGVHAQKRDWSIGIKDPREAEAFLGTTRLNGRCLATSGDYETFFSEDFKQHHLLDPRTGSSPAELSSVSIAATTAMQADALSTAVFIAGLEDGMELVKSIPGADALFVTKQGRIERTTGFPFSS